MVSKFGFAILAAMLCAPAFAGIEVNFADGAPKDRFVINNLSACPLINATVQIDLTGSKGRVIFDITASGAGVQVYQPMVITQGAEFLRSVPQVKDGDTKLTLDVTALPANEQIVFTIDVDDTLGEREIVVSGLEIEGATLSLDRAVASFDKSGRASMIGVAC